ncbi:hypothetical protein [Tenacibaculum mesophilum]|uniref:hypothetical protein n=1 Tax=Tenacibaculum mesophilum TaxID=104268 RepID=UPI00069DF7C0|nr:hypothetical protein [Tenacibaculum mesophilum]
MSVETPYEYHKSKLGVKLKYLVSDLSKSHLNGLGLISYRALKKRMDSNTCSEKQLRRGSLGYEALVEFNSLSQEWRDRLSVKFGAPKPEATKSWFSQHYVTDKDAFDFYIAHRYGADNDKKLTPDTIERYVYNASVLNTVIKLKNNRKAYAKALGGVKINIWESLSKDVNAFQEVKHNLPTTAGSLRHKVTRYQKEGYISLVSGKLKLKNAQKVKDKEQRAILDELVNKHTNLDNKMIADLYNMIVGKVEMDWEEITPTTVLNFKKERNLETFAGRNGKKALKNSLTMQRRRIAPTASMLYWTLDGWTVELLYQKRNDNNVITYHNRLTMVVVLDPYNKYPVGYSIGYNETPELIKAAMQNAINHTKELFGNFFKPYQLQSDNYAIKTLTPLYEACTPNFTPASVGNAKAKVVEPYFKYLNTKRCKLFDNWSGHNVDSGSKNQPNAEVMNLIKKNFPDEEECRQQIRSIIEMERSIKREEYVKGWLKTKNEYRQLMSYESYLLTFGSKTKSNKLRGEGLRVTINGSYQFYECFDINFRKHALEDWTVHYNPENLEEAMAVSSDGTLRYMLEPAPFEHMALADRTEADNETGNRIQSYNRKLIKHISEERQDNAEIVETFFGKHPELNDTVAKHLLTDSNGNHKIHKRRESEAVKSARKIEKKQELKEAKKEEQSFHTSQQEYYKSKVDVNKYLDE